MSTLALVLGLLAAPGSEPRAVSLVLASASGLKQEAIDKLTNDVITLFEDDPQLDIRRIEIGPAVCLGKARCVVDALAFVGAEVLVALELLRAGPVSQIQLRAFRGSDGAVAAERNKRLPSAEIGAEVLAREIRDLLAQVPLAPRPAAAAAEPARAPPVEAAATAVSPTTEAPTLTGILYPWLLGAGGVLAVAGVMAFAFGWNDYSTAMNVKNISTEDWEAINRRGEILTGTGIGMGAAGLAAAATGLFLLLFTDTVTVTAAPSNGGAMVLLTLH